MTKDRNGPYIQHQLARIYLIVGEPEKAVDQLEPLLKETAAGESEVREARRRSLSRQAERSETARVKTGTLGRVMLCLPLK